MTDVKARREYDSQPEPSEGWTVKEIEPVKPSESRRLTFKYGYKSTDTLPLKLHIWGGISRRGATELVIRITYGSFIYAGHVRPFITYRIKARNYPFLKHKGSEAPNGR